VDESTKDAVLSRIDALAEKMGTTAEYLWSSVVEDVSRRGLLFCALWGVVLVVGLVMARRGWTGMLRGSAMTEIGTRTRLKKWPYPCLDKTPESELTTEEGVSIQTGEGMSLEESSLIMSVIGVVVALGGLIGTALNLSDLAAPHVEAWRILIGG